MFRIPVWSGAFTLAVFVAAPANAQETFHRYDCTDDCSGHEAGYD